MKQNEVMVAFEILLEEIEAVIDGFNDEGADAFQKGDYDAVGEIRERAKQLSGFRNKVKDLQKEWESLFARRAGQALTNRTARHPVSQRLQRGLRTPEDAFRIPILLSLVEFGGSALAGDVLDAVYKKIKDQLNEYDHQYLPSSQHEQRWRNTAQWCRNTLVREGFLASDSPRGIWEITDAGREELERLLREDSIVEN